MKTIIDPLYNPYYANFYIKGLLGKGKIELSGKAFKKLKNRGANFNFIVEGNNSSTKCSIDHNDFNYVYDSEAYDWCDIYGKVNTNWNITPKSDFPKIVPLVPSFGIRNFRCCETVLHLLAIIQYNTIQYNTIQLLTKVIKQQRGVMSSRLFLEQYINNEYIVDNYIFFLSTLWNSDDNNKNDESVNKARIEFIRACKSIDYINFEGGLIPENRSTKLIHDVIYQGSRMSMQHYILKQKKSVIVFNTPAYHNCHGWKLGEYLAMGKAIISTPLSNDLPFPLEHGKNIYFIPNATCAEIKKAISFLLVHSDYRINLQYGARDYWLKYGTPIKSIELMGI